MRRAGLLFLLLSCFWAIGCAGSSGGLETDGNVERLSEAGVDDPALLSAAKLLDNDRGGKAFRGLVDWFQSHPLSVPARDHALLLAADALIEDGQRIKAFYYLDELLDVHPESPLYATAVARQYDIADSYLRGRGDRFLIFPVSHHDDAIEMLFRLQQRVPGSPLAEQALKRTADFYFANRDYDFAEDAYGVFIDRFPRSPQIPAVRLKQAYSNLLQYNGPRYDPTPLIDARTQLLQFAAEFPQLAQQQSTGEIVTWIDQQLAEKLMIEASFYRRTGEPQASQLLLAQVVERFRATPQANQAAGLLAERGDEPAARSPAEAVIADPTTKSAEGAAE